MTEPTKPVGAFVLGASGYVGGELLRWIAVHPEMELAAAFSASRAGTPIADRFPNLAGPFAERVFASAEEWPEWFWRAPGQWSRVVAFSAAPHTESAPRIAGMLAAAEGAGVAVPVVDLSADFRHPEAERYREIYGVPHPAARLLPDFRCGIPELHGERHGFADLGDRDAERPGKIAHPGCFATAVALAAAPFLRAGIAGAEVHASAVTGSTGAGGTPKETTHHPVRHANLFAYKPLTHRHAPEMESLLSEPGGAEVRVRFVPHSGPFARGIHATVFLTAEAAVDDEAAAARLRDFYRDSPLVRVAAPGATPRLKDIAGSAFAEVGAAAAGETIAAFCALDNLGKGAATGGMQWMNRILGLPEQTGLDLPGALWT